MKRRRHDAGNLVGRLNQKVVLGNAHSDAGDVALLKRVRANGGRRNLASYNDERRRVHVRVANGRDDVGRTGAARDHGDTGLTRGEGVALGHVTGALFVTHENVPDRGVQDGVVYGKNRATGQAEDGIHALLFEALDECLRSCELHNAPLYLDNEKGLPFLGGLRCTSTRDYRRLAPTSTRISITVVTSSF